MIDLVQSGKIDLEKIVTNEYAWTEAPRAFAEFAENAGKMLKVV
jgi:threonine dehydrogenase-like Zn-dependent dehydrogenase